MPVTFAQFSASGGGPEWLNTVNALLGRGQPLYLAVYIGLIVFFAFFYTAIVFNPAETADNLKRYGGLFLGYDQGKYSRLSRLRSYPFDCRGSYVPSRSLYAARNTD